MLLGTPCMFRTAQKNSVSLSWGQELPAKSNNVGLLVLPLQLCEVPDKRALC